MMNDYAAVSHQLPKLPGSARAEAGHCLAQWGWPTHREENWRNANLRAVDAVPSFRPARAAVAGLELPPAIAGFQRLIYVNGARLGADASALPGSTAAQDIEALAPGRDQRHGLLNDMFATDVAMLHIDGEAAIELLFIATDSAGAAVYPRLQLQLAPNSRLALVERHMGTPGPNALVCGHSSIRLGRGAQLKHYRLQQCERDAVVMQSLSARLEAEATYLLRGVVVGGAASRNSSIVQLAGRGAALEWHELAVAQDAQVHDNYLKVEHSEPATRTDELFRGIAGDRARVAFNGHIHISAKAPGAEARQSLRGLVDGAAAEIDLRPRLEINTDEVRAAHGATTGRLDENLLFYLLSRGLEPHTARALLKWAFLGDVLRQIDIPVLRQSAEQAAAGSLKDVLAAGALS